MVVNGSGSDDGGEIRCWEMVVVGDGGDDGGGRWW